MNYHIHKLSVNFHLSLMVETLGVEEKWVGPASRVWREMSTQQLTLTAQGGAQGNQCPQETHLLGQVPTSGQGGHLEMRREPIRWPQMALPAHLLLSREWECRIRNREAPHPPPNPRVMPCSAYAKQTDSSPPSSGHLGNGAGEARGCPGTSGQAVSGGTVCGPSKPFKARRHEGALNTGILRGRQAGGERGQEPAGGGATDRKEGILLIDLLGHGEGHPLKTVQVVVVVLLVLVLFSLLSSPQQESKMRRVLGKSFEAIVSCGY